MAFSVMVWLVDPGEYPQEVAEEMIASAGDEESAGAKTGSTSGYPLPRMVYGVYEDQDSAEEALVGITARLENNSPLQISASSSSRTFLIPAHRVHYVVCQEVTRPKDR